MRDVFEFVIFMMSPHAASIAARIWSTCAVVFTDAIDESRSSQWLRIVPSFLIKNVWRSLNRPKMGIFKSAPYASLTRAVVIAQQGERFEPLGIAKLFVLLERVHGDTEYACLLGGELRDRALEALRFDAAPRRAVLVVKVQHDVVVRLQRVRKRHGVAGSARQRELRRL